MLIKNANILLPNGHFSVCDLRFSDVIEEIGHFSAEEGIDALGQYLLPGLIDAHTHGAQGSDFSDGPAADMGAMAAYYAAHGVTSFFATTMTLSEEQLCRAAAAVSAFEPVAKMARCQGLHLEGPFFCYDKRGAQSADFLHAPDIGLFERVNEAAGGRVRLVAVAPELEGALPFIAHASKTCAVSIGHTACDYDTAAAAFKAGARQLTHLFNAMEGLHHRRPGPIGAGMDAGVYAELICDGLHVHPAAIRAAFSLFSERVVLISDSIRCAGMPEGAYELGGQPVVLKNGSCTLQASDTLAGSVITVYDGLVNAVRYGIPLETAAAAGTHNPARALGLQNQCGFIAPGLRADLLLLDGQLNIRAVYIGGQKAR